MKNAPKTRESMRLDEYLYGSELSSHIAAVRGAVKRVGVDASKVFVTDLAEKDIVAKTRRGIIHLDRKTLRKSTDAELEHRLRHEQAHVSGVYNEGLIELSIAPHNKTGRVFYTKQQAKTKKVTDIIDATNGTEQAVALYRQKKMKRLYRTFLLAAARKNIRQKRAHEMFISAFPELERHIQPREKKNETKKRGHLLDK